MVMHVTHVVQASWIIIHSLCRPCLSDSQANLADFGDNQWVTCFHETAETLLGHSAETLAHLRDRVRHTQTLTQSGVVKTLTQCLDLT